ncbi:MAG: phosphoglucosamine mutase [Candidatus Hydrogenedentota bacterium]|nr:MAG: phosphoglucosamine mutase [Candidatus Hydrogenedentota bacterium]
MNNKQPMISVAGIRGVVGESLVPETFLRYVLAFGTLIEGGSVVVGSDTRLSRHMMRHLAFAALESCGCKVYHIGLVPTPTVGLMVRELGASGGIAITASHNPAEWNAYKFFDEQGSFLSKEQNLRLLEIAQSGDFRRVNYRKLGRIEQIETAIERHVTRVVSQVNRDAIAARRFKVVADCVNGVGAVILPVLFEALGCEYELMYTNVDAEFPRNPEPLPENLTELGERVRARGADIGFAVDPDADRLAIVDEQGRPLGEERTVTLASAAVLERKKGPLVVNLSTTRAMDDVAAAAGVPLYRTPIGEAYVVGKIREVGALIGGEGNGGVIYPAVHCGRDAATGIGLILEALATKGLRISELNAQIPDYKMVKTKFSRGERNVAEILERMRREFADAQLVSEDGVKAVYRDSWVHLRPSGTEPVVRVFAEAPTLSAAQALVERVWQRVINSA